MQREEISLLVGASLDQLSTTFVLIHLQVSDGNARMLLQEAVGRVTKQQCE